jgi:PHP family Zn ribbon phosphoesterase
MKDTSREAYEAIKQRLQPLHEQIILAMQGMKHQCEFSPSDLNGIALIRGKYIVIPLKHCGNRYDIAEAARMHHEDCGKRLSELVKDGHIHEVGTNMGRRGRKCTVYVLDAKWIDNG